ncbi:PI-PLC X domain-containing protein 1-like [Ornithodoros turicata]|uniref:PI-PLC X domain-containing protein 1-like n=1 Tax=Ornithodoros turicata TaxID=34597 RepID=UPI00313A37F4
MGAMVHSAQWLALGVSRGDAPEECGDVIGKASGDVTAHEMHVYAQAEPKIFITVSSLADETSERQLELNWYNHDSLLEQDPGLWVGLYSTNPLAIDQATNQPVSRAMVADHPYNFFRTKVQLPRLTLTPATIFRGCLSYWAAMVHSNGDVAATSCLSTQPDWMWKEREVLEGRPVTDVMIPGAHDAGSYSYLDDTYRHPVTRFVYCQEESIFNQLAFGLRFFDLRVAYDELDGQFYVSHGLYTTNRTLNEVIQDVKSFLEATKEIVIIDFHSFDRGFKGNPLQEKLHRELIHLLTGGLEEYMVSTIRAPSPTFGDLWSSGQRLIVGYKSPYRSLSSLLFPPVRHLWGNVDEPKALEAYLKRVVCKDSHDSLSSAMAELTPNAIGLLTNRYRSLRHMADQVNRNVTTWFRDWFWKCANIVAVDYFLGSGIVEVAIEANRRRHSANRWWKDNVWNRFLRFKNRTITP